MSKSNPIQVAPSGIKVTGWHLPPRKPELIKVTDHVYSSIGYAISNVLYVITDKSVVVIDTTESPKAARASFDRFRKICQLPVSYILYTHFHGDHIRGAKVFHVADTKIIAQKRMLEERAKMISLLPYRTRADALQFGASLNAKDRGISLECHPKEGFQLPEITVNEPSHFQEGGYLPPDITFDEQYCFEEGGVVFELFHTQGETVDHMMVWLPGEKVLFPGDLFYASFPMLSNPMKPDRPVLAWAESLERMRTFHPEYLVPSHSRPLRGADNVDSALANYAKAIRYVHDETLKLINEGLPLEEIRRQVRLPEELSQLPYLHQGYGKVAWAVNGIVRQYTGWYRFNPTELNPSPRGALHRALLEVCGGPEPLIKRARMAMSNWNLQLVLELTDIVLGARPQNLAAKNLRIEALQQLGTFARNGVERNIYRAAAQVLRQSRPSDQKDI
jgi:alkyl sulfatase BDS1-like metallo-beta-lactamase superfamily hydrolase